jgi:hypothetical protein
MERRDLGVRQEVRSARVPSVAARSCHPTHESADLHRDAYGSGGAGFLLFLLRTRITSVVLSRRAACADDGYTWSPTLTSASATSSTASSRLSALRVPRPSVATSPKQVTDRVRLSAAECDDAALVGDKRVAAGEGENCGWLWWVVAA